MDDGRSRFSPSSSQPVYSRNEWMCNYAIDATFTMRTLVSSECLFYVSRDDAASQVSEERQFLST